MIYADCGQYYSLIINNKYKVYSFGLNSFG